MSTPIPELLRQIPSFAELNDARLERLAAAAISRHYPAASFLTRAGDHWPYLFLVINGGLHVLKESSEGRSLVIASIEAGELFWGPGFFGEDLVNPANLQFSQPSDLLLWERKELIPLLLGDGSLAWELTRLMVRRMLHASEVIEGLAFQPVAGRLARLLLDLPSLEQPGPVERSLTLDEMAARVGSRREAVCRLLQRFADDGTIKITRTEFEITDRERLAEMAQKEKS